MPFQLIREDITHMAVDAIVNAANVYLKQGGGVCGAIFKAAGADRMQAACNALAPIRTGDAVMTSGFDLPAHFVIHTAGPVWKGGQHGEEELLRSAYLNSLNLALEHGLKSIAFPLISSGIYGFPKDRAMGVALASIGGFVRQHDMQVYLTVFSRDAYELSLDLYQDVAAYVSDHYVLALEESTRRRSRWNEETECASTYQAPDAAMEPLLAPYVKTADISIEDITLDETFSEKLLRIIRDRDLVEADVYKKAQLDRKLFSKIRSNKHYQPSRKTVLALALALQLSREETDDLMASAGFALSYSSHFDTIIAYFISRNRYDLASINAVLYEFCEDTL